MDDLVGALARIDARLESLERRVCALESRPQPLIPSVSAAATPEKELAAAEQSVLPQAENIFSVAGKAMLGVAGAYVLRAIAESGSFPKLAVVVLALAYAGMWLFWAARAAADAPIARAAYAATAALIFGPMLAELTLRFQVLPASIAAALLSAFVAGAFALAWKRKLGSVVWVVETAAVFTALALLIISRDLVPYTAALLVMAAASEFAVVRDRWPSLRYLVSPAVSIAILILIYIHTLPESARPEYDVVQPATLLALPTLLFLIYGISIAWRTVLQKRQIANFEVAQAVGVFVLAVLSWLWFPLGTGYAGLGASFWLLSAACYTATFVCFDRITERRNYHVYSLWSVVLGVAGSFLALSPVPRVMFLSAASIVATLIGVRIARLTLEFHGLVYLTGAAFASSLLEYGARALTGAFPSAPGWMVWIVAGSALLCYTIGGQFRGEQWNQRVMRLLSAILAVSSIATFLVSVMVWVTALGMNPGVAHIAVIRTLITSGLALALAYSGARWSHIELVWIAYGILVLVTAKLLFEDLPHGHSGSIAISIFLYAISLIMVPRLAHTAGQKEKG